MKFGVEILDKHLRRDEFRNNELIRLYYTNSVIALVLKPVRGLNTSEASLESEKLSIFSRVASPRASRRACLPAAECRRSGGARVNKTTRWWGPRKPGSSARSLTSLHLRPAAARACIALNLVTR